MSPRTYPFRENDGLPDVQWPAVRKIRVPLRVRALKPSEQTPFFSLSLPVKAIRHQRRPVQS